MWSWRLLERLCVLVVCHVSSLEREVRVASLPKDVEMPRRTAMCQSKKINIFCQLRHAPFCAAYSLDYVFMLPVQPCSSSRSAVPSSLYRGARKLWQLWMSHRRSNNNAIFHVDPDKETWGLKKGPLLTTVPFSGALLWPYITNYIYIYTHIYTYHPSQKEPLHGCTSLYHPP